MCAWPFGLCMAHKTNHHIPSDIPGTCPSFHLQGRRDKVSQKLNHHREDQSSRNYTIKPLLKVSLREESPYASQKVLAALR